MRQRLLRFLPFLLLFFTLTAVAEAPIPISPEDTLRIGLRVWINECNGRVSGLTEWERGEDFASLGIGHFIWFPQRRHSHYVESFPRLLQYMKAHNVTPPEWLDTKHPHCPWESRHDFAAAYHSKRMSALRRFLLHHVDLQAEFMVARLEKALPKLLRDVPWFEQAYIRQQFYALAQSPRGLYVLVDYVNFKGEGTTLDERYNENGWGLLQVLENMKYAPTDLTPVEAFAWSADYVLTQRVKHAPPSRHEERWLPGWRNRLLTYVT